MSVSSLSVWVVAPSGSRVVCPMADWRVQVPLDCCSHHSSPYRIYIKPPDISSLLWLTLSELW